MGFNPARQTNGVSLDPRLKAGVGACFSINIYPSLLLSFPSAEAYRQAHEEGARVAGVTAHYVTMDLVQCPIIAQRAFDVPADADPDEIERRGQPLEASALLKAIRLHFDDAVYVHRGRGELRDGADRDECQLGPPPELRKLTPDRPVDGLGEALAEE